MSDFLDCISLQNCCFILWYMKKTKTKTTANSGLLFCKLSIYKLLGFKWKPFGIVYGSPLACWCLTIKTQGFSEEKNIFSKPEIILEYIHVQTRFVSPQEHCEQVLQNTVQIPLLVSFTVDSWLPWHISPASVSNYYERWARKLWWHCKDHSILF